MRNAVRHGLTLAVCSNLSSLEELELLAREMASTDADPEHGTRAPGRPPIGRGPPASYTRHELLSRASGNRYSDPRANLRE